MILCLLQLHIFFTKWNIKHLEYDEKTLGQFRVYFEKHYLKLVIYMAFDAFKAVEILLWSSCCAASVMSTNISEGPDSDIM